MAVPTSRPSHMRPSRGRAARACPRRRGASSGRGAAGSGPRRPATPGRDRASAPRGSCAVAGGERPLGERLPAGFQDFLDIHARERRPNGDPVANPRSDTTCRTGRRASQSSAVMRWIVVRSMDVARTTRRSSSSRPSSSGSKPCSRDQSGSTGRTAPALAKRRGARPRFIGSSTRSRRNWRASNARLSVRRLRTGSGICGVYGTVWAPTPVTMVGTASAAPTPRGTVDQTGLVERASQGDHEAFGVLIGAHLARLDTAARLILRDPELARDAVQEATLRAWRNLRGLRDPDRFDAWLHRPSTLSRPGRQRRGRVSRSSSRRS